MGSNNARNYIHLQCGADYRRLSSQVTADLAILRPLRLSNKMVSVQYDRLLAKQSFFSAVLLANDSRLSDKNEYAREGRKTAVSLSRFNRFFNELMIEYRRI